LALNWLLRPGTPSLFAIIAPKLIGGAVERNRVKRWVREAYRRMQPHLPPGLVSIWIARRESPGSGADRIAREMQRIYQKAGLWTGDHPSL
jgi:ribonuclease P protein component